MELNRLEERVLGRELARDMLAVAESTALTGNFADGFWAEIAEATPASQIPELPTNAMTDEEAAAFEREVVTFGRHAGEQYRTVPPAYLTWLADKSIKLRRYVQTKRFLDRGE